MNLDAKDQYEYMKGRTVEGIAYFTEDTDPQINDFSTTVTSTISLESGAVIELTSGVTRVKKTDGVSGDAKNRNDEILAEREELDGYADIAEDTLSYAVSDSGNRAANIVADSLDGDPGHVDMITARVLEPIDEDDTWQYAKVTAIQLTNIQEKTEYLYHLQKWKHTI